MKNLINKFFSLIVSVDYYIYLTSGVVINVFFYLLEWQTLTIDHLNFLKNIGIPVVVYSITIRLFCQIFYQEKYDEFAFRKIDHNMHIGIPRIDNIFYSSINEKQLKPIRKFSGYAYAFSKPLIFIIYGMIIVSLLVVISSKP